MRCRQLLKHRAALVRNAGLVTDQVAETGNELLCHLLIQKDVGMMLTQPAEHPADGLPHFGALIAEEQKQGIECLRDYFQELLFIRSVRDGAERDQAREPHLPVVCRLNVRCDELDGEVHDVVSNEQGQGLETAACGKARSLLLVDVHRVLLIMQQQQSLQNELHKLLFALGDVVEAERAGLLLPLDLVLDESGPELIGQRSNSRLCTPSRLLREHAHPREVVLQVLVLLRAYLRKALEDVLLRFLVVAIH